MPSYTDQTGNTISLTAIPKRIVSLVPSQTELLFDLGLHKEVVGITKFCIHPTEWFRTKTRVGGTKDLHLDTIRQLNPDLILANKEENTKEQIEALAKEYPVWMSDIKNLEGALHMIEAIGEMAGVIHKSTEIIHAIRNNFNRLKPILPAIPAAYFIWQQPYMTIGGDTFISDMMNRCGFTNIFNDSHRYPETSIEELEKRNCKLLLLSSEPFPFKEKHIASIQILLPHTKIVLVDGEYFSWYGSRLVNAPLYFRKLQEQLIHLRTAHNNLL